MLLYSMNVYQCWYPPFELPNSSDPRSLRWLLQVWESIPSISIMQRQPGEESPVVLQSTCDLRRIFEHLNSMSIIFGCYCWILLICVITFFLATLFCDANRLVLFQHDEKCHLHGDSGHATVGLWILIVVRCVMSQLQGPGSEGKAQIGCTYSTVIISICICFWDVQHTPQGCIVKKNHWGFWMIWHLPSVRCLWWLNSLEQIHIHTHCIISGNDLQDFTITSLETSDTPPQKSASQSASRKSSRPGREVGR